MSSRIFLVAAVLVALAGAVTAAVFLMIGDAGPGKNEPEAYTRALVDEAIERYQEDGR